MRGKGGDRVRIPSIFLRDDDVWRDDRAFLDFFTMAQELCLPVVYGVIPARLEPRMAALLKQAKKRSPHLLDIVQHGFNHENYAVNGAAKYEFGPRRTDAQQYRDMAAGLKIMKQAFGVHFTPAFVPPFHGFDAVTLRVVERLGFRVFSAGKKGGFMGKNVLDLPAGISLNGYGPDGTPHVLDGRGVVSQLRGALLSGSVHGGVYHHEAARTSADMRGVWMGFKLLAGWRDRGEIRPLLFSDLLRAQGMCRRSFLQRTSGASRKRRAVGKR